MAAKQLVPVLKGIITIKSCSHKSLTKIPTKEEISNFCKTQKARFREKFDFRLFIVTLTWIVK